MNRLTFEEECEADMKRALQFGRALDRLFAPKSNIAQFPARDGSEPNKPLPTDQ